MLSALAASLSESPSLTEVRLVAACLLAFLAFLRYDEVAKLRCCDVTFGPQNMAIRILCSKTDQYCQGDKVLVARTCSPTCPVVISWQSLDLIPSRLGCIGCDWVEPQLQQMWASRIDCLNAMVGGGRSQPRMVMLKTLLVLCCQYLRA